MKRIYNVIIKHVNEHKLYYLRIILKILEEIMMKLLLN